MDVSYCSHGFQGGLLQGFHRHDALGDLAGNLRIPDDQREDFHIDGAARRCYYWYGSADIVVVNDRWSPAPLHDLFLQTVHRPP